MTELNQIMEYVNSYTGTPEKFKRGVVLDNSLKDEISVTIVATGFKINNLPQVDIGDPDTIILGTENLFSPETISGARLTYGAEHGTKKEESATDMQEAEQGKNEFEWKYRKPEGKPALILEPGDDITKLEREPAYLRRERLFNENSGRQMENEQHADTKTELPDENYILPSDNS